MAEQASQSRWDKADFGRSLANAYPGKINDLETCVGLEGSQSGCKNHSAPRHEAAGESVGRVG